MLWNERGFTSHPRLPFQATGFCTPPDAGGKGVTSRCFWMRRRVGDSEFARDAYRILVAETPV